MGREAQPPHSRLTPRLEADLPRINFYRFCQLLEKRRPGQPLMGGTSHPADDPVRFYPHPGMGFPASELKAVEYDEADDSRPPVIRTTFMGLYGVDSPLPTAYLDDIAQHREGHEALQGLLDIFNHRIMTQFYRIWRKYSWPATFEPGGTDRLSQSLLGLAGLGIPGTTQHIASPASRFLALTGVLRQPGKTQQGIQALVTLLAPETTVRVSPYSLRPVAISQPLGFYGDDDFFLDGNTPLGDEAMDASSQLLVALTTDNPAEAQGWKPDGPLFRDFLILLRVYLGWRFRANITLTAPTRLLAVPPLGDEPFWLGTACWAWVRARVRTIFLRPLPPSWVPIRACSLPPFYKETDVLRISLTKTACLLPLLALCLSGCGLTQRVSEGTKSAFNAVFYKKINTLHLDFTAREALNTDARENHSLSEPVVVRIYQLKDRQTFDRLVYQQLLEEGDILLAADLLASRDVVIGPGGDASLNMPLEAEATFVAVVGLFRHPDTQRNTWKQVLAREELDPDKPRIFTAEHNQLRLRPEAAK